MIKKPFGGLAPTHSNPTGTGSFGAPRNAQRDEFIFPRLITRRNSFKLRELLQKRLTCIDGSASRYKVDRLHFP